MVSLNIHNVEFVAACNVPMHLNLDLSEIIDLSWAVISMAPISEATLLKVYKESFLTHSNFTYLQNWPLIAHRVFGTIMPKYRNKPPLKYNLNDTQIVLALCFTASGTNACLRDRPFMPFAVCSFKQIFEGLRYVALPLLPVPLTQSRSMVNHSLSHVQFGGTRYYHPAQRILSPPLSIAGCSYQESLKQPEVWFQPLDSSTQTPLKPSPKQKIKLNNMDAQQTVSTNAFSTFQAAAQQNHQQPFFTLAMASPQPVRAAYFANMPPLTPSNMFSA